MKYIFLSKSSVLSMPLHGNHVYTPLVVLVVCLCVFFMFFTLLIIVLTKVSLIRNAAVTVSYRNSRFFGLNKEIQFNFCYTNPNSYGRLVEGEKSTKLGKITTHDSIVCNSTVGFSV